MSDVAAPFGFRRILVALDASHESRAALSTAADLARQLDAELMGLFVEDIDLLNLAALPFSREIPVLSLSGRNLDLARTERELRAGAAAARRALAAMAERRHLQWSFRVVRGRVDTELLTASREADLITVDQRARQLSARAQLGSAGHTILTRAMRSVLIAARETLTDAPVAVVSEASGISGAIALAARLAERNRRHLVIFLLGDSPSSFAQQEVSISSQLRLLGARAAIQPVRTSDPTSLWHALQATPISLLILDAVSRLLPEVTLDLLIEKSNCSLLLLRERASDQAPSQEQEGAHAT